MGFAEGKPGQDKVDKLKEALGWVNDFVADEKFAAGTSQMTLADISLLATYSSLKVAKKYSSRLQPTSKEIFFLWHPVHYLSIAGSD